MGYICEGGKRESEHAPLLAAEVVVDCCPPDLHGWLKAASCIDTVLLVLCDCILDWMAACWCLAKCPKLHCKIGQSCPLHLACLSSLKSKGAFE